MKFKPVQFRLTCRDVKEMLGDDFHRKECYREN